MKKSDVLNIIKDAEEKAAALKKRALSEKERIIYKARNDAKKKLDDGRKAARAEYEQKLEKARQDILKETQILSARKKKELEEMKARGEESVDAAAKKVVAEFERWVNV